tara:strand:- start:15545 stop:16114 length:570 start_codon:yes stop_codon:yes gene_type:complete
MRQLLAGLSWSIVLAYPFIVLFGLQLLPLRLLGLLLIALAALRIYLLRSQVGKSGLPIVLSSLLLLIAMHAMIANDPSWMRFYPVAVNVVMLGMFGGSLRWGPPFVERLARMSEPELPATAIAYTRKVTIVWCLFFAGNGLIAWYTAVFTSFDTWALYNGAIAYALIGTIFSIEWLIRRRIKKAGSAHA